MYATQLHIVGTKQNKILKNAVYQTIKKACLKYNLTFSQRFFYADYKSIAIIIILPSKNK